MNSIEKVFMKENFQAVIKGYCDTLSLIKNKTGKKGKGDNKLQNLAKDFGIDSEGAHDALEDVIMLDKVVTKLGISDDDLRKRTLSWDDAVNSISFSNNSSTALKELNTLKDCTSYGIRKKIITAKISVDMIIDAYKENQYDGLLNLLGKDESGLVKVTKNKKVLGKIFDYLSTKYQTDSLNNT